MNSFREVSYVSLAKERNARATPFTVFRKSIFLFFLFFAFALVQVSFFSHFAFWGFTPNMLFVAIFIFSLWENPISHTAFLAAIPAGFFLDVFSQKPLGFWIALFLGMVFALKILKQTYVRIPLR